MILRRMAIAMVLAATTYLLSGCATYLLLDTKDREERLKEIIEVRQVQDGFLIRYKAIETASAHYTALSETERVAFIPSLSGIERKYDYIYGKEACDEIRQAAGRPEIVCSESSILISPLAQSLANIDVDGLQASLAAGSRCTTPCYMPIGHSVLSGLWLVPADGTVTPTAFRIYYMKDREYSSPGLITTKTLALPLAAAFDLATSPLQFAGYLWLEYGDWHFGF